MEEALAFLALIVAALLKLFSPFELVVLAVMAWLWFGCAVCCAILRLRTDGDRETGFGFGLIGGPVAFAYCLVKWAIRESA